MSGKYLLDTNIVIGLFAGDEIVAEVLRQADSVFVASIVLGELYFGAHKSVHVHANLARIDQLAASVAVLGTDVETARRYGEIKNRLRQKGRPIPENDIWLAALALQYDLVVLTRDEHFDEVEGLRVCRLA